ncbi:hypothetical protein ScPMuIL_005989 [Solemya velum]
MATQTVGPDVDVGSIIEEVQEKHGFDFELKKEQKEILVHLSNGQSVFGQVPTGFGKSMTYTLFPLVMEKIKGSRQTGLVISPLRSLIKDQHKSLMKHQIMKDMDSHSIAAINSGEVSVILASPEAAMLWFDKLVGLCDQICLLCFDEAHCVSQWKVTGIISHFCNIPTLVLTATATEKVYHDIHNMMALPEDTKLVACLPDRNIRAVEKIYIWFMVELGENAFVGRLIKMYHSRRDSTSTCRILENFQQPNS